MSRIGNKTITIPQNVTVTIQATSVTVAGPAGSLSLAIPYRLSLSLNGDQLTVSRQGEDKQTRSNHGSLRAHLQNMVKGVVTPWTKQLEIRGTGYKAQVSGNKLTINVGFIHPVHFTAPDGIQFVVTEDTIKSLNYKLEVKQGTKVITEDIVYGSFIQSTLSGITGNAIYYSGVAFDLTPKLCIELAFPIYSFVTLLYESNTLSSTGVVAE
jgi:large subunit ribosomal protein L6